jgi:hypothetical protein
MSATRRRIVATIRHPEGEAPSLDLVRTILARRAPGGIRALGLHWSSYFRIYHRRARQLRRGRIFIAGDAAHIHSPFGGQGMNVGLHDVWNLAWKLDLFLRGRGNERLLDSYDAERLPAIDRVIATTDLLTRAMGTSSRWAQAVRDVAIPIASRLPPIRRAFVQRLSELDIAYAGSPIIAGSGKRYLDESMRGGGIGSRFLVIVGDRERPSGGEAARELCEELGDIVEVRLSPRAGVSLVRPDGYLAYASRGHLTPRHWRALRQVLARQVARRATRGAPPGSGRRAPPDVRAAGASDPARPAARRRTG